MNGAKASIGKVTFGSIDDVVARYYRSAAFASLADSTKSARRNIIERFREKHGTKSVKTLTRKHIDDLIRAKPPAAGKNFLKALRELIKIAIKDGLRSDNPTVGVDTIRTKSVGFHSWTEDEIAAYEAKHPLESRARLAHALLLYTGQRRGDVVRMGRQHVREGRIHLRQEKTGSTLAVPIHPTLQAALDAAPRDNMTFLVTHTGKPFAKAGFGNWFRECCDAAGLPHCSAHGLRKAAARRLAEAGATASEIAAVTGHTSLREVERYTKAAAQMKLADAAMSKMAGAEHEQILANQEARLAKKADK